MSSRQDGTQALSLNATDDPAERKRLLNVLAQRRYRNRKRAHLASLESKLKSTLDGSNRDVHHIDHQSQPPEAFISDLGFEPMNFQLQMPIVSGDNAETETALSQPLFPDLSLSESALLSLPGQNFPMYLNSSPAVPALDMNFDLEFHQVQLDSEIETLPSGEENFATQPSTTEDSSESNSSSDLSPHHFERQISTTFSDEAYISIPALSLIRAHGTIIQRIQRPDSPLDLWDPFSPSPFYSPPQTHSSPLHPTLTKNYHPTPLQKLIPHHPIFDLLPWPSARNKLLQVMSLPLAVRPRRARDEMHHVVVNLIWDMKDAGGGLRVWGQDPFDEGNWEVGQRFFELWWWALDAGIVERSNELRKGRGEDVLRFIKDGGGDS